MNKVFFFRADIINDASNAVNNFARKTTADFYSKIFQRKPKFDLKRQFTYCYHIIVFFIFYIGISLRSFIVRYRTWTSQQ